MKLWKSPEMKLYSVKLSENIAASGEENNYERVKLYVTENGVITFEAGWYNCQGTFIQDTQVQYAQGQETNYFWESDRSTISGCLA